MKEFSDKDLADMERDIPEIRKMFERVRELEEAAKRGEIKLYKADILVSMKTQDKDGNWVTRKQDKDGNWIPLEE